MRSGEALNMAEMHYSEYLNKVRGCIMGLGDMSWIEPALRVVAKSGADFTAMQLADAYEKGGALTPHFLRNMDRGIFPPLAVFDDPEQGGAGGMDCAPLWACVCPGDPARAREYAGRDASVDHQGEAVEAAQFLAAAMALAFIKDDAVQCLKAAAEDLPEGSRLAHLVADACALCSENPAQARARLDWRYGGVDGSLIPKVAQVLTSLLLNDQPDRLAAAFRGLLTGAPSTTDVGDAIAARVSRAGLSCMAMEKSRGENLPVNITAAPFAAVPMTRKEEKSIRVSFMGQPVLRPGQARQCVLSVENHTAEKLEGPVECKVSGCVQAMTAGHITVAAGETARVPFTVWMPENVENVTECNLMTVAFAGMEHTFGIAGAQGYRVCGKMGLPQHSIFEGRNLPENPLWETYFCDGNKIELDELNGWIGPCALVLERTIVAREELEADIEVARTCPFVLELDGEILMQGDGSDGWAIVRAQEPGVLLEEGEHTLRLYVDRCAPGGSIEVDFLRDGRLLSLEAKNPRREA